MVFGPGISQRQILRASVSAVYSTSVTAESVTRTTADDFFSSKLYLAASSSRRARKSAIQ